MRSAQQQEQRGGGKKGAAAAASAASAASASDGGAAAATAAAEEEIRALKREKEKVGFSGGDVGLSVAVADVACPALPCTWR